MTANATTADSLALGPADTLADLAADAIRLAREAARQALAAATIAERNACAATFARLARIAHLLVGAGGSGVGGGSAGHAAHRAKKPSHPPAPASDALPGPSAETIEIAETFETTRHPTAAPTAPAPDGAAAEPPDRARNILEANIAVEPNTAKRAKMATALPTRLRAARQRGGSDLDVLRRAARDLGLHIDWLHAQRTLFAAQTTPAVAM